jgi:hypothetical protein
MHFDQRIEEEPERRRWSRRLLPVGWLATAALLACGPLLGFGIYAPQRGAVAAGEPGPGGRELPRDRAKVRVEAAMARPGERPTPADVARFYGLQEDAVACTVQEANGLAAGDPRIERLSRRPLKVGDEITLCLD